MFILLRSYINPDQWYQSGLLFSILLCMSPTRSGYKELGLDLVELLQDQPRKPRRMPMGDEKKYEGVGDPIKILLKEALKKQRNAMMDNFAQILQPLPTGGASVV